MRLKPVLLATLIVLFGCVMYYLGWRQGAGVKTQPEQSPSAERAQREELRKEPPSGPIAIPPTPPIREPPPEDLSKRRLILPLAGIEAKDIQDTFNQGRPGGRKHEATDILAPRNTPILAMDDGIVAKLFTSKPGGLTVYQFDNDGVYCYYYAHLDHYPENLHEKQILKRGDVIGYVGTTGDAPANTPHLHLAIFRLGPDKHWWQGTPINPYPILMGILQR